MTNLKDKLSASVRQARATQEPAEARAEQAKPAPAKATAAKPASAKPKTPAKPAAAKKPTADQQTDNALFPSRVWPD